MFSIFWSLRSDALETMYPGPVVIFSEGNKGENDLKKKIWGRLNLEEAGTDN